MAVDKISVSLDEELADLARRAAAEEGVSLSAWITRAAQDRLRNLLLGVALDEVWQEIGPMSSEEMGDLIAQARADSVVTEPERRAG